MNTLELVVQLPEDVDDPAYYLGRVLTDMRSQGRWQMNYLIREGGVPLRDPTTFLRIGTLTVRVDQPATA